MSHMGSEPAGRQPCRRNWMGFQDWIEFGALTIIAAVVAAVTLLLVTLFVMYLGFAAGLWSSVPCALEASQPHCVQAGWGHHTDIAINGRVKR